jgi:hypothetical protein
MMKKLLFALALVLCLVFVAQVACAELPADPDKRLKSYTVSTTGAISTAYINSNDLIVGWQVIAGNCGTATPGGAVVGLYDTTALTSCTNALLVDETEAIAAYGPKIVWYPYARQISTQLYVFINDANAQTQGAYVIIYYEDR